MIARQAWRRLRAQAGVSVLVAGSLAAGIAANAILFAIVDAAVLRPFPFPEPDRFVGIGAAFPRVNRNASLYFFEVFSGPEYAAIKDRARTLTAVTGLDLGNEPVMTGDTPERVFTGYLWDDAFAALGMTPFAGRGFSGEELRAGAPVAIVSHAFWRSHLASDAKAVGRSIRVGGRPHTLVGIMPPRARLYGTDLWIPMRDAARTLPQNRRQFNVVARLAPGVTIEAANAELTGIARQIEREHAAALPEYKEFNLGVRPWSEIQTWQFGSVAGVAFAACGLLLLLITANLANLLLARAADRGREMAVRVALGAARRDLVKLVAAEALLLTVAGAIAGIGLAWLGARAVPAIFGEFLPDDVRVALSGRLLLFVAGVSVLAGLIVSIAPAWQLASTDPARTLAAETGRAAGSRRTRRLQRTGVALQVAIAVIVAGSAALLAGNVARVLRVDPGFPYENLLAMRVTLPLPRYEGGRSMAFFDEVMTRTRALPQVADASVSNQPPPGLFSRARFEIEGESTADAEALPTAFYTTVGPRYRETLGLELARGRWFDERADRNGPREIVITEEAAARLFAGDAIGRRIRIAPPQSDRTPTEIVGIVRATRNRGLLFAPGAEIIGSFRQIPDRRQSQLYLVVRGRSGTDRILADVQAIIRGIDPEQPVYAVSTIASDYRQGVEVRRAAAILLGTFAALALALSALGTYGVASHAIESRRREIGVRAALGASRASLARMVVADALRPIGAGVITGIGLVFAGSRVLASWVYGITPEITILAGVALVLVGIGVVASLAPARRAGRIGPLEAMR